MSAQLGRDASSMDFLLALVPWSLFWQIRVTALEENNAKKLSNLGDTKNIKLPNVQGSCKAWRTENHSARRLNCSVPISLLSRLRIMDERILTWLPEAATRAINLWRFFKSRYVNMNRLYLFGPRTLDLKRVADCLGNFVDAPFPGS
ncbi:hypothetical protein N7455_002582 [Penicillium solitum]|uniref:uncharacterized protein n=1 Tax=Penicillium solitum TaxID=60172 RepID=UPI0032C3E818|nr:hypothetical protein N7455_002582 [Penicillium solitum]